MEPNCDHVFWVAIVLGVVIGALFGALPTSLITYSFAAHMFADRAVKAGHAEYYLDENNQRQWRWK